MSLLVDVKACLTSVSNVYLGDMPDSPDNAVAIYNTGGYPRSLSGTMVEEPTVMIKVRHTVYSTGLALCETIKDLLHGVNDTTKNTHDILLIEQQSDVLDLGRDESNRCLWSMNFRLLYRR